MSVVSRESDSRDPRSGGWRPRQVTGGCTPMRVQNIHERVFDAPAAKVSELIDGLSSANGQLWPIDRWPAMQFDLPLGVGASGGHGPIRYAVKSYVPCHNIQFRFIEPKGFVGVHRFEIEQA
jgi:hypothetical protein